MTTNITTTAKTITKAFADIKIETKDDVIKYMNFATTLTESAQFAKAWVLKLAKENVFDNVLKDTVKYAEDTFGIKRASAIQYIKLANEYLVDATKTHLLAYYDGETFKGFADDETITDVYEKVDFSYTQISVLMSKGIEKIKELISNGTINPFMTVSKIKEALTPKIEADFTDNSTDGAEATTTEPTEKTEAKSKTVMYVDTNGTKHTFDEITATDSDKTVFFKTVGEFAVTVEISLLDIDSEEATAKITKYVIEK